MTKNDKPKRIKTINLIHKKEQFNALTDGIPALSEADIRRMATFWLGSHDAMIQPLDKMQKRLTKAMSQPEKIEQVLDRLPKESYDLVRYIRSEGSFLTVEELLDNYPIDDVNRLPMILEPLTSRGLVWECRSAAKDHLSARLFILESCADLLPLPSYLEGKFGTLLPARSKEQLLALARAFSTEDNKPGRGLKLIPWLKSEMRNPSRFRRFFDSLEIGDRKVLKILSISPEGLSPEDLYYEFALFTNTDPENKLADSLRRLANEFGLIDVQTKDELVGRKMVKQVSYRLSKEASHLIRTNFREKFEEKIRTIPVFIPPDEDFALGTRGKERPTLWIDFQQLLNHLIRCEVGVIRKGGMHKKNLKRILDRLEGQLMDAYLYLDFLFLYAYERDILAPEGERWKINIERILPIQEEEAFYRDFWAFYRNNGSWNDRDSSPLQGVLQKGESRQIFALRRAILRMLQDCPVGQWIEMREFFDQLCDRELAFCKGEPPIVTNDPEKEKYRFMKSIMERSLSWIGIVDTTTIQAQRLNLFRLTEIGSWLLSSVDKPSPFGPADEAKSLNIMPNLEIQVPANFILEKQLFLARFTDDQKGRIVLNRASIRRGLNEGLSINEMKGFLAEHVSGELPPNAPHLLEEVNEKAGHILVGGEPIGLEVNNHMVLDELLVQKRFIPFIQERSSDKRVLLRRDTDIRKLMEELRKAGYTPRSI